MKESVHHALILAAGFGTRMGALSVRIAKSLLPLAGKPVIQYLAEKIFESGQIESLTIVTNHFYFKKLDAWVRRFEHPAIHLLDNGVTSNEKRFGAIADLRYAAERKNLQGPLLVTASDNLYGFDFSSLLKFYECKQTDIVTAYEEGDPERLRKTGVASLDKEGRVTAFEEKPREPAGNFAVPPLYIFTGETLQRIGVYLREGNNPDAPGNFIAWLHGRVPVHAFRFTGSVTCIGDAKSYARVQRDFERAGREPPAHPQRDGDK